MKNALITEDLQVELEIAAVVKKLLDSWPALKPLAKLISKSPLGYFEFNNKFLKAYHSSDIPYAVKSLLVRAMFGDRSVQRRDITTKITQGIASRLLTWLATPERLESGKGTKDDIPKSISTLLGIERYTDIQFISEALMVPVWEKRCADEQKTYISDKYKFTAAGLKALQPLIEWRTLTAEKCIELANDPHERHGSWYFQTGVKSLDFHNLIMYVDYILAHRDGGRVQNQLPLPLSDMLNIPRKSVPDMLAALDLLSLDHYKLINWNNVNADPLQLKQLHHLQMPAIYRKQLDHLMREQALRYLLSQETAEAVRDKQIEGVYDTGLLFNIARLLADEGRLHAYAPYYQAIDTSALSRWIRRNTRIDGIAQRLPNLLRNASFAAIGIRLRDLANILGYILALDVNAAESIPRVALYALGVEEFTGKGKTTAEKKAKTKTKPSTVTKSSPKELDVFLRKVSKGIPKIAVIRPPYTGPIPTDVAVFLPASIAASYLSIPDGVLLSGSTPLPWGHDAYERKVNPEWGGSEILITWLTD